MYAYVLLVVILIINNFVFRFLHIVNSPEVLKSVSAIENEMSQLEDTRRFHLSLYVKVMLFFLFETSLFSNINQWSSNICPFIRIIQIILEPKQQVSSEGPLRTNFGYTINIYKIMTALLDKFNQPCALASNSYFIFGTLLLSSTCIVIKAWLFPINMNELSFSLFFSPGFLLHVLFVSKPKK